MDPQAGTHLVVVHDDVGQVDHVASEEVRAPAAFTPQRLQVVQRVSTRIDGSIRATAVVGDGAGNARHRLRTVLYHGTVAWLTCHTLRSTCMSPRHCVSWLAHAPKTPARPVDGRGGRGGRGVGCVQGGHAQSGHVCALLWPNISVPATRVATYGHLPARSVDVLAVLLCHSARVNAHVAARRQTHG